MRASAIAMAPASNAAAKFCFSMTSVQISFGMNFSIMDRTTANRTSPTMAKIAAFKRAPGLSTLTLYSLHLQ